MLSISVSGQYSFSHVNIPVTENGLDLNIPWAGGLNSIQYNSLDINDDRENDLVLFDRTANKLLTFLWDGNDYVYSPEFEVFFPDGLVSWVLLRDYDCDGVNDLFTDSQQGLRVFRNIGLNPPAWELVTDPLITLGSQLINLFFNDSDIPSITDLDGDGDLDILAYNFATGINIDFHRNMSIENSGVCGLEFVRTTRTYGGISECDCGDIKFDETCLANGRIKHTGGKALLAIDLDGDGDKELFTGEEGCDELALLINEGDEVNADFSSMTNFFEDQNISNVIFPAAYNLDVDHDDLHDLLISPNIRTNSSGSVNLEESSLFLKNVGSNNLPNFQLVQNDFLQEKMIDVGENARPAFFDYDNDNDYDLFIGSRRTNPEGGFTATINLYENVGESNQPAFSLLTEDYLNISSLDFQDIQPQFIDISEDSQPDLVLTATLNETGSTLMYNLINSATTQAPFNLDDISEMANFSVLRDYPTLADIDNDGVIDLLVGRRIGTLEFYRNLGTNINPDFQLEDPNFLNISTSIERIDLVPLVADLNKDGVADLITTDASGELSIYEDFQEGTPRRLILNNRILENTTPTNLGRISWPSVAEIHNSGSIDMVIGTLSGGLFLLRDTTNQSSNLPDEQVSIEIFPNPSQNFSSISIRSNETGTIQVFGISGKEIISEKIIRVNQPFLFESALYPNGIYVVKYRSIGDVVITKRFIIGN